MKTSLIISLTIILSIIIYPIGNILPKSIISTLDRTGIVLGYLLSCLSFGAAIVVYLNRIRIKRWFLKNHYDSIGEKFNLSSKKVEAMIIPVSRKQQPEWILRWLKPKNVSLIYSQKTLSTAKEIAEKFSGQIHFFPPKEIMENSEYILNNPFDPHDSYVMTKLYLQRFLENNISPQNIFVDTTGGTVPMSIGCFQAAEKLGVSSIYIIGTNNGFITDSKNKNHGIPIFLSNKTEIS